MKKEIKTICKNCNNQDLSKTNIRCLHCGNNSPRKYIEKQIDYELASGVHTYRLCKCKRSNCRSIKCVLCWKDDLKKIDSQDGSIRKDEQDNSNKITSSYKEKLKEIQEGIKNGTDKIRLGSWIESEKDYNWIVEWYGKCKIKEGLKLGRLETIKEILEFVQKGYSHAHTLIDYLKKEIAELKK